MTRIVSIGTAQKPVSTIAADATTNSMYRPIRRSTTTEATDLARQLLWERDEHDGLDDVAAGDAHRGQVEQVAQQPDPQRVAQARRHVERPDQIVPADERQQDGAAAEKHAAKNSPQSFG